MRFGLVASVCNEAPYLIEWIAHHRALGFDPVVIFHNGCVDGTDTLLATLAATGAVHARANDPGGFGDRLDSLSPIHRALRRAAADPALAACDYVLVCDIDEFLVLPQDGDPSALVTRLGQPDILSLPWRVFGSTGALDFDPAPVATRCPNAARPDDPGPKIRPYWQIKSLFRPGAVASWRQHAPVARASRTWLSADGRVLPDALQGSHLLPNPDFTAGSLHHYHVKSQAEFFVKLLRGYGDQPGTGGFRPGLGAMSLLDAADVPCPMPDPLQTARRTEASRLRALPGVLDAETHALNRFHKLLAMADHEIRTNASAWAARFFRNAPDHTARIRHLLAGMDD